VSNVHEKLREEQPQMHLLNGILQRRNLFHIIDVGLEDKNAIQKGVPSPENKPQQEIKPLREAGETQDRKNPLFFS
jgi:hypothetical protein